MISIYIFIIILIMLFVVIIIDNILVRDNYTTLLSDFGESKRLYNEERDRITTIVGTPYYIAPEILREEPSSLKSDVFSFGITALVVSTFYHYRMRLTREYCRLVNQDTIDPFRKRLDPVEFIFNYGQKERMKSVVTMKKVASGWRPKIPMPFQRHWPKLCKVIENCLLPSVEDRPTAKELMKQFKTITSCITGTEVNASYLHYPFSLIFIVNTLRTTFWV